MFNNFFNRLSNRSLIFLFSVVFLFFIAVFYYYYQESRGLKRGFSEPVFGNLDGVRSSRLLALEVKGDDFSLEEEMDKAHLSRGGLLEVSDRFLAENVDYVSQVRSAFKEMREVGSFQVDSVVDLESNLNNMQTRMGKYMDYSPGDVHDGLSSLSEYTSFVPTDLGKSGFRGLDWLGSNTFGSAGSAGWSAVRHFFKDDTLGYLQLIERMGGPSGYTSWYLAEEFNSSVNGLPARYTVEVDDFGVPNTTLTWQNGDNVYSLVAQVDVSGSSSSEDLFFDLARSLPSSGGS